MARVFNFNAGPSTMPRAVQEKAQAELLDLAGSGMSVMELSHRSKEFKDIIEGAEQGVRRLLNVPDTHAILFLQGGASLQFAMLPMNLRRPGRTADYVDTGTWALKAINEAKTTGAADVIWSGAKENYTRVPRLEELRFNPEAEYVHICTNETILGTQMREFPETETPLVADMSSEILSRPIDVSRFGLIYAGAQKNLGPSGLVIVIIRKDLAERVPENVPIFLRYSTHMADASLYHTPNTWGVYMVKLICEWTEAQGGVPAMQKINEKKAATLYQAIDSSYFWRTPIQKESRSMMNVVWWLPNETLDNLFVAEAKKAGLVGLKGHRVAGGIRASIYNGVPAEGVDALVSFMKEFERVHG